MTDRDAARTLYLEGWSQKEIAKTLHKAEKTIGTWKRDDNWDKSKAGFSMQKTIAEDTVWELINYQLTTLKRIKDEYEKEPDKPKLIARGDIDALQKLFTTVKGRDIEWSALVKVMREFATWLRSENLQLAQEMMQYADAWLNEKRKQL
jgi:hypothetical protein